MSAYIFEFFEREPGTVPCGECHESKRALVLDSRGQYLCVKCFIKLEEDEGLG